MDRCHERPTHAGEQICLPESSPRRQPHRYSKSIELHPGTLHEFTQCPRNRLDIRFVLFHFCFQAIEIPCSSFPEVDGLDASAYDRQTFRIQDTSADGDVVANQLQNSWLLAGPLHICCRCRRSVSCANDPAGGLEVRRRCEGKTVAVFGCGNAGIDQESLWPSASGALPTRTQVFTTCRSVASARGAARPAGNSC